VCALVDSENIHSFVDPSVLQGQQFFIEETHPLIVKVVNVARMMTDSKNTFLNLTLQGHDFTSDFHLLQIQGYDLILGVDWLSQFELMIICWHNK
jgi:Retroviral aspartyl protease